MMPRCPRCESAEDVERSRSDAGRWYCTSCNLTFVGSPDEWAAEKERRIVRCTPPPGGQP
jgi:transposase-like protein